MFKPSFLSPARVAGPGYIILNGLRAINIIGLLAVMTASVVMLIKLDIESNFFFFDAVSHVITVLFCIFLIFSEASVYRKYFRKHWPHLGPEHGFVALGLAFIVFGVNVLGCLNKKAHKVENLGLAFWRIIVGAGILALILGVFNVIASYIFRDGETGVTARQIRAKGAVALNPSSTGKAYSFKTGSSSGTTGPSRANTNYSVKNPYGTPAHDAYTPVSPLQSTPSKSAKAPTSPKLNPFARFKDMLPSYHHVAGGAGRPRPPSSNYSVRGEERKMNISGPMNVNPHLANLVRPDSSYHPSRAHDRY